MTYPYPILNNLLGTSQGIVWMRGNWGVRVLEFNWRLLQSLYTTIPLKILLKRLNCLHNTVIRHLRQLSHNSTILAGNNTRLVTQDSEIPCFFLEFKPRSIFHLSMEAFWARSRYLSRILYLHPTEHCGMQLIIPAWGTWPQIPQQDLVTMPCSHLNHRVR